MSKGRGQKAFSTPGGAGDQDRLPLLDVSAIGQQGDRVLVQATRRAVGKLFQRSLVAKTGRFAKPMCKLP